MLRYQRFIAYLNGYVNGEKQGNVGYIRCHERQGICQIYIALQDRRCLNGNICRVYLYRMEEENVIGHPIGEFTLHNGRGELRLRTKGDNVWGSGRRIDEFMGIVIQDDHDLFYASKWEDESLGPENKLSAQQLHELEETEKQPENQEKQQPKYADFSGKQQLEYGEKQQPKYVEAREELQQPEYVEAREELQQSDLIPERVKALLMERPKLPDFDNHEVFDCVKICPNDIGQLDMANWRLGVNSFLTHGYYQYQYLLMGKIRFQDGAVKAVLGVPGIFDNKERYIAKIFGFELFVPVKHTQVKTGNFGYWLVELT